LYANTICTYNGRDFTYPQDALRGIAGVFSAMLSSFPGGFVCGLPRLFLDHTLLWQPFGVTRRRIDRRDSPVPHSSLPSYSWCGWQSFVDPGSLRSGLSYIADADGQQRAESWRTQHTVDWSMRTAISSLETIGEPLELDECINSIQIVDNNLRSGWARSGTRRASSSDSMPSIPSFFDKTEENVVFTHPRSLPEERPHQNNVTIPARLVGSATTATFTPATILQEVGLHHYQQCSASFVSMFKSQLFQLGLETGKACPVLVLRTQFGGFGGLLQLMDDNTVERSAPIELIAISEGSATGYDMRRSYLWTVFETGRKCYNHRTTFRAFGYEPEWLDDHSKGSMILDLNTIFSREAANHESYQPERISTLRTLERRRVNWVAPKEDIKFLSSPTESERRESERRWRFSQKDYGIKGSWFWHRNKFLRKQIKAHEARYNPFRVRYEEIEWHQRHYDPQAHLRWQARARWLTIKDMICDRSLVHQIRGTSPEHPYSEPADLLCEFYNVLWIEWKDGIAYRRARGWVPKDIWEAHSTGPVKVTLG
jgi:hypothetical protein